MDLRGRISFASSLESGPKQTSAIGFSGPTPRDENLRLDDWCKLATP